ncbi:BppU family phage baseplate upper protein [Clostridium perfringens]|nr:BppU family phage baseplate upper protein [Clostridium perfringens]MDK0758000.1 BppU family phage baseplate upper protein [Clostridium perfringens]
MSEIGLNINVDSYNNEGIKTIKGNNNAEIYKLYILKNKRRLSLVGKNVKLGYVMAGTTNGDIIENLNITNAEQGEITFPITNRISKQDGVYSCQLAIYGADGFLEHTATFGLTVEANIFTKIAGEIADNKDFTYLENILDKASKLSEKLKENTATATNANSNLESNIIEANNINSKLLENTSTATSLNKNLESNIDLAKEVKETIKDLDTKNIEATSNIGQLTDLNNRAQELSNSIQQALPINTELKENIKIGQPLVQEATTKNTELQASLEKTKEFINGLDGSQNIPQIRMDVTELQNGLKSNQALAYKGSSVVADNTLEGRTEGMIIKGRTLQNLIKDGKGAFVIDKSKNQYKRIYTFKPNYSLVRGKNYSGYIKLDSIENVTSGLRIYGGNSKTGVSGGYISCADKVGVSKFTWNSGLLPENVGEIDVLYLYIEDTEFNNSGKLTFSNFMLFEEGTDLTYIDEYFEGLKSFGEAEQEGDKYKISILSHGKNLLNINDFYNKLYSIDNLNIKEVVEENRQCFSLINNSSYFKNGYTCNFKENTQYTLQGYFKQKSGNSLMLTINYTDGTYQEFRGEMNMISFKFFKVTTQPNKTIKFIGGAYTDGTKLYIDKETLMIVESAQSSLYEPYKENKKDILIKEPLRSKGDICDLLYEDNGQVKIDRYVGQRKYQEGDEKKKDVLTDKINTVYALDKPITEIVENCVDIDLDTFGEKTYFNILNSIKGSLDFKVPSNIASIVQSNSKAINELYNLIDTLVLPNILQNTTDIEMLKLEKLK